MWNVHLESGRFDTYACDGTKNMEMLIAMFTK